LSRLPIRFDYDDNYYNTRYQGIPEEGYSAVIARVLDHPNIEVKLGQSFAQGDGSEFNHVFYTGPLDAYFGHRLGRLGYRTVTFERVEEHGDFQGNAVINYTEAAVAHTRIHEHKHFAPWEKHEKTVAFIEFSKATEPADVPYYPIRRDADKELLKAYYELARQEEGVSFLGRLGTYRYLDMDDVIDEALDFSRRWLSSAAAPQGIPLPKFSHDPWAS
jgi:UDP-galactopyranose mutase